MQKTTPTSKPPKSGKIEGQAKMTTQEMRQFAERVEHLCARCEHLARENATLKKENRHLRDKSEKARERLAALLANLPEYQ